MPRSTHRPAKKRALSPGKFANRVRATRRRADKKRLELRRDHLLRELEELDRMEGQSSSLRQKAGSHPRRQPLSTSSTT